MLALNGVILPKRPVINVKEPPEGGIGPGKRARGRRVLLMLRLLKLVVALVVLVAAIVVGYAYLGDLSPDQENVSEPLELNAN